jgi:hypothetical protein
MAIKILWELREWFIYVFVNLNQADMTEWKLASIVLHERLTALKVPEPQKNQKKKTEENKTNA